MGGKCSICLALLCNLLYPLHEATIFRLECKNAEAVNGDNIPHRVRSNVTVVIQSELIDLHVNSNSPMINS